MADVITLDGLESTTLSGTPCGELVSIEAPMLGQSIRVCEADAKRMGELAGIGSPAPRRRGRPKNSTVKNGARRPKFKECKTTKTVVTKNGKTICKCADQGNGQILAGVKCGLPTKKGR